MNPLVSVIMPVFNAEKFIDESLDSILNQTFDNFELVVIDDGSLDKSMSIVESKKDERIRILRNKTNLGIAQATNKGIQSSSGKYIALMDDDDISEIRRLEWQVEWLEQHDDIDVLGGRTTLIDQNGNTIRELEIPRNNPKYIKAILLFQCMDFMNSTVMYRRSFIEKYHLNYQDDCLGMQDYYFYIQSSKVGNISSLDKFLLKHRIHDESESSRQMTQNKMKRAELYAKFQRYSIDASGFNLTDEEYGLINKTLTEECRHVDTFDEWIGLRSIFEKMLCQGLENGIDYYDELRHFLRIRLQSLLNDENTFT